MNGAVKPMRHDAQPTAAEIADSLNVASMGGDLRDLANACATLAQQRTGAERERLQRGVASMVFAADVIDVLARLRAVEGASDGT